MTYPLFTIGYHPFTPDSMLPFLKENNVGAVVDVRAWPGSRLYSDFNAEFFGPYLRKHGIYHLCMGKGMGVRPSDPDLYTGNRVDYEKIASWPCFINDLERLHKGVEKFPVCLMCKEADPAFCHRAILIARQFNLRFPDVKILHILENGVKISQQELDVVVMGKMNASNWLFPEDMQKECEKAYQKRSLRIAWKKI